ncbi:MAG TPA: cobyric acid synthase [Rubrobacter sp.]|nr:cobyric acid synthase [Rubrobacter sp.]
MNGALLVAGTHSDAGKSVLVAGICRWLAREGVKVAPFKAQNMALNSFVTREGAEIGRAQAAQAAAAMVEPEAAMNPVLLKPSAERTTQVVVRGKAWATASAKSYGGMKRDLLPIVLESLEDLRSRFDVVVCEGAGSPAEINLRENDLANMGLARAASLPVLLVGDIDRGGLFASLYGTLALLSPGDQALLSGFLVNKFRGDPAVLEPGLRQMTALTGRPFLGTLPFVRGLGIDGEDSLTLDAPRPAKPPLGRDVLRVAVARLGRISNFTDFDALAHEPGVAVRFTESREELVEADLAVLPGTKATVDDLWLLRSRGLDLAFAERVRRGLPTLGICGGYQMLGRRILDGVESGTPEVGGLGLLPVETTFEQEKVLARPEGLAPGFGGAPVSGYEIHHGRTVLSDGVPLFVTGITTEGCRAGATLGTSWHGVLESDAFRRALLAWVAAERNLDWRPGDEPFEAAREAQLERLGDLVAENVDGEALLRIVENGAPRDMPVLKLQASGFGYQEDDGETSFARTESGPNGGASTPDPVGSAEPSGSRNLEPETRSPKPSLKAEA